MQYIREIFLRVFYSDSQNTDVMKTVVFSHTLMGFDPAL